ncbi:ATP-dependent DNA helicase RecG [Gulosibacter macacae]|uniref:Probable DNA 3'-5' helicase RecG n=1 Tax=Gulosibacter macacae TaxID=2488791 RepID=A0A3P3VXJ0_9MICO|nr:ATP-dependent DNA helicase RecG [Gulosibacter macacae]RRJ86179.1 ATP-dependent DNA helicase RecG [Gulosibacter macacae]
MNQPALDRPLSKVAKPAEAAALEKAFGIRTVGDLIAHLPRRHVHRGELTAIAGLEVGEHVTLVAEVVSSGSRFMQQRRGNIAEVVITDGRGQLKLTWFNQKWRADELKPGTRGLFSGQVSIFNGKLQLTHPDYKVFDDPIEAELTALDWTKRPIPIYPATAKVASWRLAELVESVLDDVPPLPDPVPEYVRRSRNELDFDTAIRQLHRPDGQADLEPAREALKFTEALELQTVLAQQRARAQERPATPLLRRNGGMVDAFDAQLPFALTADQRSVGDTIAADLGAHSPMHRMLQGEVGSGKTIVAVRAMLQAADSGAQSALLAPTEVLAAQHLRSITASLGEQLAQALKPTLLTGSLTKSQRQQAMLAIVTGESKLVVGTHALLGDKVEFDNLGLVIVDEQHRFGVEQREQLRRKGRTTPHMLVLTATPIPRTVAMTVFGDLDVSSIRQLPSGRAGIESFVVPVDEHPMWLDRVWRRTSEELAKGRQAFVVCPAIAPGEEEGTQPAPDEAPARPLANVVEVVEQLRVHPDFVGRRIEPLHGAMSADDKDATMLAFAAGEIDVVVSTTVIEVGVDVPNASTMVVLDADRFGISQLHQLRGRVGRGQHAGLALLVTAAPAASLARERVDAVAATTDGFELAERDLEFRREGDVLGTAQSGGRSSLKLLRVTEDLEIIEAARDIAVEIVARDPELRDAPALRDAVARLGRAERDHLAMG